MRTRSVEWERWVLATPQKMCGCLIELIGRGYRGSVTAAPNGQGDLVWLLEINSNDQTLPAMLANLGQIVILIGTRMESLTREEYLAIYGDTDGS